MLRTRFSFIAVLALLGSILHAPVAMASAPSNDDFDSAKQFTSVPFTDQVDTTDATKADDDPQCVDWIGHTVWYAFTPTQPFQTIEADTSGSNFDTVLAVFTGSRGSLSNVECNNDYIDRTSLLQFQADMGKTYYIMAGGFEKASGSLKLDVHEASGDLAMTLAYDPLQWKNSISGNLVLTGTLSCNRRTEGSEIDVSITQDNGHTKLSASGYTSLDCDGATRWMITLHTSHDFSAGRVGIDGSAYDSRGKETTRSDSALLVSCTRIGTLGDDVLRGTLKDDRICGLDGNDRIEGRDGNDLLRGADGNDAIDGGSGRDVIFGGFGNDKLSGGDGDDKLTGNQDDDHFDGGSGKDECVGGSGDNRFRACEK